VNHWITGGHGLNGVRHRTTTHLRTSLPHDNAVLHISQPCQRFTDHHWHAIIRPSTKQTHRHVRPHNRRVTAPNNIWTSHSAILMRFVCVYGCGTRADSLDVHGCGLPLPCRPGLPTASARIGIDPSSIPGTRTVADAGQGSPHPEIAHGSCSLAFKNRIGALDDTPETGALITRLAGTVFDQPTGQGAGALGLVLQRDSVVSSTRPRRSYGGGSRLKAGLHT
jgi:hypothetical protein